MINKEFNKNSLFQFYYSCPLFKKYCKQGLWFGSFEEYKNIRYCEKYLQKYTYLLFQNNDLFKSQSLIIDPHFIKFMHSGFFYHINSHFLIAFYENAFLCSFPKSKLRIEKFVENYFHSYLYKKLEKEFLVSLLKSINKFNFINFSNSNSSSYFLLKKNLYSKFSFKNRYKLKKKDIQILFEQDKSFNIFSEKKKSIGLHKNVNTIF